MTEIDTEIDPIIGQPIVVDPISGQRTFHFKTTGFTFTERESDFWPLQGSPTPPARQRRASDGTGWEEVLGHA